MWAPPSGEPTLHEELCAWSLILPQDAAFTHLTAGELFDWWLPSSPPHPVFVAMRRSDPRPRRPGLLACRHPKAFAFTLQDGLKVTTPAETLLAAARDLGVLDLVVMGDSALRLGQVTRVELEIAAAQRRRGAPLLRQVIPLLDKRSESAWESIMRVLQRAADVPVEPQFPVHDADGRFLAGLTSGSSVPAGCTSTTVRTTAGRRCRTVTSSGTAHCSRPTGNATASPHAIC